MSLLDLSLSNSVPQPSSTFHIVAAPQHPATFHNVGLPPRDNASTFSGDKTPTSTKTPHQQKPHRLLHHQHRNPNPTLHDLRIRFRPPLHPHQRPLAFGTLIYLLDAQICGRFRSSSRFYRPNVVILRERKVFLEVLISDLPRSL